MASCIAQEFIITHKPSYVTVQEQKKPLAASDVPEVITNTLGLSQAKVNDLNICPLAVISILRILKNIQLLDFF